MIAKVLVVDDEPDLETLVSRRFRSHIRSGDWSFEFARDGHEAIDSLTAIPDIDLVVTDINMPNMDGLTLLNEISKIDPLMKTVILSAYGDMSNIRTAMNRGAFDFLTKPVDLEDLEKTIQRTLDESVCLRDMHRARSSAERVRERMSRYFSPSLVSRLVDDREHLNLNASRRELTFLFTDLAGFTPLVERLDVEVIVSVLNQYLEGMVDIAFNHGATIEKIVGDALHCIFGAPQEQQDHATRALSCALEMDEFASKFALDKRKDGIPMGVTRFGINTGMAIIGNFGSEKFFDYTAHGDAVNTAARLEAANKQLGSRICISNSTVEKIPDFYGRPLGRLVLKGRSGEVLAYEPLSQDQYESEVNQSYIKAYDLIDKDPEQAKAIFESIVNNHPGDDAHLAAFHLRRLKDGECDTVIRIS